MPNDNMVVEVEKIIGYKFENKSLLIRALTHSSYSNENFNSPSYERLEFIGDAVVEYIISLCLLNTYPNASEGVLSKKRASLVNANTLSKIVDKLGLAKYLRVGACDSKSHIRNSEKVRCDIFEAILGAMLLDSGKNINLVGKFVIKQITPFLNNNIVDYKSKLLEVCAQHGKKAEFCVIEKDEYKPYFKVKLVIDGEQVATGDGRNKKQAEKQASKIFLTEKIDF